MKKLLLGFLLLSACHRPMVLSDSHYRQIRIKGDTIPSPEMQAWIKPYKDELGKTMNKVLIQSAEFMEKAQPEGKLGNLLADGLLEEANKLTQKHVDAALLNYGGIRTSLPAGPVTVGRVFEILPFDNQVVVVEISDSIMQLLLNKFAFKKGTPVAGIRFTIKSGQAINVKVGGAPLSKRTYRVALPDYIANGGDDCGFLINQPKEDLNILLRDLFLKRFESLGAAGKTLSASLDGRITVE